MDNDELILPFDKCYCLHLAEANDRYYSIKKQFKKIGITNQVDIWWTCRRPISIEIGNNIDTLRCPHYEIIKEVKNKNVYGNVFNVSFEQYTIIKQAYLRGFNSILIMEDDIIFDHDKQYYIDIFNNLPEDWDILRLGFDDIWCTNIENKNKINEYFFKTHHGFPGACMYALSRRGMEYYLNYMDTNFETADNPLIYWYRGLENYEKYKNQKLNIYVAHMSIISFYLPSTIE